MVRAWVASIVIYVVASCAALVSCFSRLQTPSRGGCQHATITKRQSEKCTIDRKAHKARATRRRRRDVHRCCICSRGSRTEQTCRHAAFESNCAERGGCACIGSESCCCCMALRGKERPPRPYCRVLSAGPLFRSTQWPRSPSRYQRTHHRNTERRIERARLLCF